MGTNKKKKPFEEQEEKLDFYTEEQYMAADGYSTGEDAMKQRNSAITIIQQKQSGKMGMDAMVGYRALLIYDRYASRNTVQAAELEQTAISCFTISLRTMDRQDFSVLLMSNRNLITDEIQRTEDKIVRSCRNWDMRGPNSFTFLNFFVDGFPDLAIPLKEVRKLIVKFQKDKKSTRFKPSVITAAAILKITSKVQKQWALAYACCKQQLLSEEGFMKGNEVEIRDCESAMEKWCLIMEKKGEISLENWVVDLYGSSPEESDDQSKSSRKKDLPSSSTGKGKAKEGEVASVDSLSQVKPGTVDTHEEGQGGPSTASDKQLPSSPVKLQTSEIHEEGQGGLSSTDKGKGKVLDNKREHIVSFPALKGIALCEPSEDGILTAAKPPFPTSTDKGKGKEVLDNKEPSEGGKREECPVFEIQETQKENRTGRRATDEMKEEHFRVIFRMLKEDDLTVEMAQQILTATKQTTPTPTVEKEDEATKNARYPLLGFKLNWDDDEEMPEDSGEKDHSNGNKEPNKVKQWMAKNKEKFKKKFNDFKEKLE